MTLANEIVLLKNLRAFGRIVEKPQEKLQEFDGAHWLASSGYVIGIGGCTNSGKTTLAHLLAKMLRDAGQTVTVISQDDYFYEADEAAKIPGIAVGDYLNYDSPKTVNWVSLYNDIKAAVRKHDFVVVEGNMLTEDPSIINILDRLIFILLDERICYERRSHRTDYDPPDKPGYFESIVWPAYKLHLRRAFAMARGLPRIGIIDGNSLDLKENVIQTVLDLSATVIRLQDHPIQVQRYAEFVGNSENDVASVFVGNTQVQDGKCSIFWEYEADDALIYSYLQRICYNIRSHYQNIDRIVIVQRVGIVKIGDAQVLIAISANCRGVARMANKFAQEEITSKLPIWRTTKQVEEERVAIK